MSSVDDFVKNHSDSDYGYCGGDGSGCGSGYGIGDDSGFGDGHGSGCGSIFGFGFGGRNGSNDNNGSDYGNGSGYGYGSGLGKGYNNGDGGGYDYNCNENIKSFNGNPVYYIDGISTIITKVRKNVAKGFILNDDLTTTPCYVIKHENTFAHGATLAEAREALRNKLFEDMSEEERIDAFLDEFNLTDKYPAKDFFNWHNRLTGSCKQGRETFVKNHGIDLERDAFTVREFCELCKNGYGGNIIEKIIDKIKGEEKQI